MSAPIHRFVRLHVQAPYLLRLTNVDGVLSGQFLARDLGEGLEVIMKVLCAWCEQEGKRTLIREVGLANRLIVSHGICCVHEVMLLKRIRAFKKTEKTNAILEPMQSIESSRREFMKRLS